MMLDMKRTFDEIVEAHADPDRAAQILANPFYQSLSSSFAGTQEYMAMEKLGQLRRADEWDLIVVDTPPSRSALDFLDAPQRLGRFLDGRLLRLLTAPAKVGGRAYLRVLNAGFGMVTGVLTKILGAQVLRDVQTFVTALDTMFGGFRERADYTYQLLRAPGTAFLVVAAPEPDALREASYFVERLAQERMPLAGLLLNRVQRSPAARLSPRAARPPPRRCRVARRLRAASAGRGRAAAARRADAAGVRAAAAGRALHRRAPVVPVAEIPAQARGCARSGGPARHRAGIRRLKGRPANRRILFIQELILAASWSGQRGLGVCASGQPARRRRRDRTSVSWRRARRRCARTCSARSPAVPART